MSTQSAFLAKIDSTPQTVTIDSIALAGIPNGRPVLSLAPGQVIQILGANLGPSKMMPGIINSGLLATSVAGVQVTFDGVAVPLLAVGAQEIDLVTPFELAGKSLTSIQVIYNSAKSNLVQVPIRAVNMQVLAVMNEDFTLNSAQNPAKPGSVMELYVAGVGNSFPTSQDGQVNAAPLAALPIAIQLWWFLPNASQPNILPITFAGSAYGLVAGVYQVNFQTPPQSESVGIEQVLGSNSFGGGPNFQVYIQQ